jgi:SAM-dependent methyltransferase
MDAFEQNRQAWNRLALDRIKWSTPVSGEVIQAARNGDWSVVLTPTKPVPREWFGDIRGKDLLGLASGGGQQVPIFAAAGANVTCLDAAEEQLALDRLVADREGLSIRTEQGDMRDLSRFPDNSFDLVFNPCSTSFVESVLPIWREVARVLRPGGALLTGFTNPWFALFDIPAFERGELVVTKKLPVREEWEGIVEFSHTLQDQIGGQLQAGLHLTDMFEDEWDAYGALFGVAPAFIATRAVLPVR